MLKNIKARTIVFIVVVPLLVATSLIKSPCPVCDGTGVLATTPGMKNVEITEFDSHEWRITRDACGLYILYFYDLDISLYNKGSEPVEGWLKFDLIDISKPERMPVVDTQYGQVELPGLSGKELTLTIVFDTGVDAWGQTEVRAEVITGDVPDTTCGGTGEVPSNTWLFVNSLKDTFSQAIQSELEYRPPQTIDWADYTYFNE